MKKSVSEMLEFQSFSSLHRMVLGDAFLSVSSDGVVRVRV